jgi:hypothetical protein
LVASLTFPTNALAQAYTGDLKLTTQAAVDAFNYTEVTGNLYITSVTDLSPLSRLRTVRGDLEIVDVVIDNAEGLASLQSVGGKVRFKWAAFHSFNGLSSLNSIGGSLMFEAGSLNPGGGPYVLSSLTTVGGSLSFLNCSVDRVKCPSLTRLGGNLLFEESSIGNLDDFLPNLTSVQGVLMYQVPTSSIDFLSLLTSVGELSLKEVIGLDNLDGLSAIKTISGSLTINFAPGLKNLNGLSSLTLVGGSVTVANSDSLQNIEGLSLLSSVGGTLSIDSNHQLAEFCGLWPLISGNGISGNVMIRNNAANPTVAQIIAAGPCDADRDGVPNLQDLCPASDVRPTVWVLNCDSGVPNRVSFDGCSVADRVTEVIAAAATGARNHGQVVSRAAKALNALVSQKLITANEQEAMMRCVGSSRLGR